MDHIIIETGASLPNGPTAPKRLRQGQSFGYHAISERPIWLPDANRRKVARKERQQAPVALHPSMLAVSLRGDRNTDGSARAQPDAARLFAQS